MTVRQAPATCHATAASPAVPPPEGASALHARCERGQAAAASRVHIASAGGTRGKGGSNRRRGKRRGDAEDRRPRHLSRASEGPKGCEPVASSARISPGALCAAPGPQRPPRARPARRATEPAGVGAREGSSVASMVRDEHRDGGLNAAERRARSVVGRQGRPLASCLALARAVALAPLTVAGLPMVQIGLLRFPC
jgi:hypothetical protein